MGNKNSPWNNNGFLLLGSRSWLLLVQLVVVYLQRLLISNVCLLSRAASAGHRSPSARWGSAPLPGVEAEKRCAALGSCSRQGVPAASCALGCQGRIWKRKSSRKSWPGCWLLLYWTWWTFSPGPSQLASAPLSCALPTPQGFSPHTVCPKFLSDWVICLLLLRLSFIIALSLHQPFQELLVFNVVAVLPCLHWKCVRIINFSVEVMNEILPRWREIFFTQVNFDNWFMHMDICTPPCHLLPKLQ